MLFDSSNDVKIVNSVNTKKQLLDYLKKGSIDVVLLSIDFAESNGMTIMRIIKKEFKSPDGNSLILDVELFTWEKLDFVDKIKNEFKL